MYPSAPNLGTLFDFSLGAGTISVEEEGGGGTVPAHMDELVHDSRTGTLVRSRAKSHIFQGGSVKYREDTSWILAGGTRSYYLN